jgi:hypothetical protein
MNEGKNTLSHSIAGDALLSPTARIFRSSLKKTEKMSMFSAPDDHSLFPLNCSDPMSVLLLPSSKNFLKSKRYLYFFFHLGSMKQIFKRI